MTLNSIAQALLPNKQNQHAACQWQHGCGNVQGQDEGRIIHTLWELTFQFACLFDINGSKVVIEVQEDSQRYRRLARSQYHNKHGEGKAIE